MIVVSFSTNIVVGMYRSFNLLIEENFGVAHHDCDSKQCHDQEAISHYYQNHHSKSDKQINGFNNNLIHFAQKEECYTKSVNFYSFTKVVTPIRTIELHAAIIDLPFKSSIVSFKLAKTLNAIYTDSGLSFVQDKLHIVHHTFLI